MTGRDDGGPAFPVFNELHGEVDGGMSLRDWFATHAPEMPAWFVPTPIPMPTEAQYPSLDGVLPVHRDIIRDWLAENIDELPEELKWYEEKRLAAIKARAEWTASGGMAAIVEWRWMYADAMLAARKAGAS